MAKPGSVDEYLAHVPAQHRPALERLRSTIKSVAPDATEVITYQMPGFRAHGRNLVSYAAFNDHYSLFPMGVSVVNKHLKELDPYLSGKSTIRFSFEKPLPVAIVRMVVKERLAENAAKSAKTAKTTTKTPKGTRKRSTPNRR